MLLAILCSPGSVPSHTDLTRRSRSAFSPDVSGPVWSNATSLSPSPPQALFGAAMAYDPPSHEVVLFGGTASPTAGSALLDGTWTYANGSWTLLHPFPSPPARHFAGMVFDAADGALVLFGGGGDSGFLNDTWTFSDGAWTEVCGPAPSHGCGPLARWGLSLAYDTADQDVVLFGGCEAQPGANASPICPLNDTWTFRAGSWTEVHPAVSPQGRYWASFADAGGVEGAVLFGGFSAPDNLGDTWLFHGGSWLQQSSAGAPTRRQGAALAYDPGVGAVVLFGGQGETPLGGTAFLSDTYAYSNGAWTAIASSASTPPACEFASLAYDADWSGGHLVLFGGQGTWAVLEQTWAYGSPVGPPATTPVAGPSSYLPWVLVGVAVAAVAGVALGLRARSARASTRSRLAAGTAQEPPLVPVPSEEARTALTAPLILVEGDDRAEFWRLAGLGVGTGAEALVFSPSPEGDVHQHLPRSRVLTISHTEGEQRVQPGNLDRIGHLMDEHLSRAAGGWVVFDGLNMFVDATSQKSVRRLLQVARETAQDRGGHVLCRLNPKTLSASELSQLEEGANVLRAGGGSPEPLQDPPRTDRRKD